MTSLRTPTASTATLRRWPTEVFLVCGADRAELRARAARLADVLAQQHDVPLVDLAFTLNRCLPAQGAAEGVRLAVVAGSAEQLAGHLAQAAERLDDPQCRRIHDAQGIYFAEQPLYAPGRLAVLFPGEGSPYVNMLADLVPHFPEVGEHFERCDRVFLEAHPDQPPASRSFLLPEGCSERLRREAAEQMLRIDRALAGVLIANWAVYLLLLRLRLQPDAVLGHSSGELSALAAAGAIVDNDRLFRELYATADILSRQEIEGRLAHGSLLAAATSAERVERLLGDNQAHAWVAMDNCPHQTVVGGEPEAVDALRRRLEIEGVLCEVLPFARPYHTRLFEPHVGPIEQLYQRIDMEAPRLPVYSCATAAKMPADVAEVRRLAVGQWSQRVQFGRTLEAMYDDGIRIFLEVGPRSNLTSFAGDALRGRDVLLAASNVPHRDGTTQLNHMAGQLLAHGVPLSLKHFYSRRSPAVVDWAEGLIRPARAIAARRRARGPSPAADAAEVSGPAATETPSEAELPRPAAAPGVAEAQGTTGARPSAGTPSREAVMARHLQVMEQFLSLQQQVHEQFLDNLRAKQQGRAPAGQATPSAAPANPRRKPRVGSPPETGSHSSDSPAANGPDTIIAANRANRTVDNAAGAQYPATPVARADRPMLGRVESYEPGRTMVVRRQVDLGEDLYALDHTLGGRFASALESDYHGLAVMPMAMSLEWMAEAALAMVPGKRVIGLNEVKLHRWIPLFDDPVTLELSAELVEIGAHGSPAGAKVGAGPGAELPREATHAIRMAVRDLGNAHQPPTNEHAAAQGIVLLGDQWLEAPEVDDFEPGDERPCPLGPRELYRPGRLLFHGPAFQAVASGDRLGRRSVEGRLRVLSHAALFASCAEPDLVLDPVVIDASTHVLGLWHLAQPDQTGRVLFPYGLGTVRFYGPRPAEGALLKCQVKVESSTDRQVMHRIDIFSAEGPLWCRLYPAQYWRFYWPQPCVRFFRHHDEHLASEPLDGALPAEYASDEARLSVRWMPLVHTPDLVQPVIRAAAARVGLSPAEWQTYYTLQGPDKRRTEMAFGHLTAKDCVRELWARRSGERLFPVDLEIKHDPAGRPRVEHRGQQGLDLPEVSLSHTQGAVAAIAAYKPRVGIDIERIAPRAPDFEQAAFDKVERALLDQSPLERSEAVLRLWCAKEAVGKALGVGLAEGPHTLRVRGVDWTDGRVAVAPRDAVARQETAADGPAATVQSPDATSRVLLARTSQHENYVVAVSFAEPFAGQGEKTG